MMFQKTFFLLLTLFTLSSANAVDVVICEKNGETAIEIADIYEAQRLRKLNFTQIQNQPEALLEQTLWNKLETKSKARLSFFKNEFPDSVFLKRTRIQSKIRFENNWTNSYVFLEKNCQVQSFAEVYKKQFKMDPDYIIDESIWAQLTPLQKLMAKTHLLFAKESAQNNNTEIRQIQLRYLNSLFWSSSWENLSTKKLFELSKQLSFETESYQNYIFSIQNNAVEFWNDDILKSGPFQPGIWGATPSGEKFLQNFGVFHQNIDQSIVSLPHRSELEFETPLGKLKSSNCQTQFYQNSEIKFTCFSPQQNIQIKNPLWELQYLTESQKNAPTYFYPNGQVYSARNVQGHYQTIWGQRLHFAIQGDNQFAEIHWSNRGEIIYIAQIQEALKLQTNAGKIETDTNTFASFYPNGNLKCSQAKNKILWLKSKKQKIYKIENAGFCLTEEGFYHPPGEDNIYLSFTDSFQIKDQL